MAIVYRTEKLEAALKKLCTQLNNVKGAVIVSIEGFVVAAYEPGRTANGSHDEERTTSSPQVAAMAATLIALGERTLARLGQGDMVRLLVEGDYGAMLVVPASNRAAIALMVNNDAKMGLSLYALKQIAVEIRAILEGEE
jgi:predicted regulator of Ras-like GTPase activity (Roadblock/LC7/MglB family)